MDSKNKKASRILLTQCAVACVVTVGQVLAALQGKSTYKSRGAIYLEFHGIRSRC